MNSKKYTTTLKATGKQPVTCGKTGISFTLDTVTDEQIEKMIKAGSKAFTKVEEKAEKTK